MKNWFKNKLIGLALALSSVEKESLNQVFLESDNGQGKFQGINQGTLMDSLVNGEITQEVEDLRWRMFRVLEASEGLVADVTNFEGVNEESSYMSASVKRGKTHKEKLRKVKLDEFDDYPLELVFNNSEIKLGGLGSIEDVDIKVNEGESLSDSVKFDETLSANTATLGNVSNESYNSSIKSKRPLLVYREFRPKFKIEDYTTKMNVRTISDSEKLLEFYVSEYPDIHNKKSNFFLTQVKKGLKNPRHCDFLDIKGVSFMAYKTPGARDFHQYQYEIKNFDKIINFDGHYVIKFKCEVKVNGEYLLEKYRSESLDERYKNKDAKK